MILLEDYYEITMRLFNHGQTEVATGVAGRQTCHDLLLRGGELIIAKQAEGACLANYTGSLSQLSDNL